MSSGSGNVSSVVNFGGSAITSNVANGVPPFITLPPSLLANVTTIVGGNGSTSSGDYYGFYSSSSPGSTAQYQVPSGKTFYVLGFYFAAGVGDSTQLGYGTAALAAEGTGTPPTGAVYYGANSTSSSTPFIASVAAPAYTYFPVPMSFPANSYPFFRPSASSDQNRLVLIGYVQ